jgi:hypothetical protein
MRYLVLSLLFLASCTPVQYVYVDQKDSVVKKQRVIYDDLYVPSPFFFNSRWGVPYYNPIIIQRQRPIVVPQRPTIRQRLITPQRPQYRPLPPRPPRKH